MPPKESFYAKQQSLKQQQEAEEDEATAEHIEREMAEEINAQAEQNAFRIPAWVNITGALLGVLQLSYRIEQERERRADDYFANPRPEIYSFVASMSFEVGVAVLIAINCVLLGWQASLPDGENADLFNVGEHIFVTLFLIEWSLRVIAFGWVWIFELSNAADTVMASRLFLENAHFYMWIIGIIEDSYGWKSIKGAFFNITFGVTRKPSHSTAKKVYAAVTKSQGSSNWIKEFVL